MAVNRPGEEKRGEFYRLGPPRGQKLDFWDELIHASFPDHQPRPKSPQEKLHEIFEHYRTAKIKGKPALVRDTTDKGARVLVTPLLGREFRVERNHGANPLGIDSKGGIAKRLDTPKNRLGIFIIKQVEDMVPEKTFYNVPANGVIAGVPNPQRVEDLLAWFETRYREYTICPLPIPEKPAEGSPQLA